MNEEPTTFRETGTTGHEPKERWTASLLLACLGMACQPAGLGTDAEQAAGSGKSADELCAEQALCADPVAAAGDLDGNGLVEPRDLRWLRARVRGDTTRDLCAASGDLDRDGVLGRADVVLLREALQGAGGALQALQCEPEPSDTGADSGGGDTGGGGSDTGSDTGGGGGSPPESARFYVAPDGSDSNPGTLERPFATLEKLASVLEHGDLAYLRGGTYRSAKGDGAGVHFLMSDLQGTVDAPIRIETYPGEVAVFDLGDIEPTYSYPFAMGLVDSAHVKLKGHLVVKNLRQISDGSGISRGFDLRSSHDCTVEWLDVYNMGGTGFVLTDADDNLVLNVDSHHNGDGLTRNDDGTMDSWDNADGFSSTGGDDSTGNVFRGCRAWLNSDDGWDFFDWAGDLVTIEDSWSFWEGVKPWGPTAMSFTDEADMTPADPAVFFGDSSSQRSYQSTGWGGEGFKCGGGAQPGRPTTLTKVFHRTLAFENIGTGYAGNQAAEYSGRYEFLNAVAYRNGNDGWSFATGWATGIAHTLKNDWAWDNNQFQYGGDLAYDGLGTHMSHDLWATSYDGVDYGNLAPAVGIGPEDFLSVSSEGTAGPRGPNGELPALDFLRLQEDSDLVDAGTDLGLGHTGAAPDLGAFER